MKAVIIEIGKDYCIVMTGEGQFLKQRMPHGIFEIGDEIIVSEEHAFKPAMINVKMFRARSFAVAASVIVILAVGSIFGVQYLRNYYSREITGEDKVAEEKLIIVPEPSREAPVEEEMDGTEETALGMPLEGGEDIAFSNTYSFEEKEENEEDIKEIIRFSYKIVDDTQLKIQLRNISDALSFSGTFKLVVLYSDGKESKIEDILLDDFGPGRIKEYPTLFLKQGETQLRLEVTGNAY